MRWPRFVVTMLAAATLMSLGPVALAQNAVNTATVAAPASVNDPVPANNTATDTDPIARATDLALTKSSTPDPVVVGGLLTYTLTVANAGPSAVLAADTFSIIEALPAGLSGCTYTPSTGTFTVGTIAPGATGTGTWTGAAIPSGGSITLTIACTVDAAAAASIANTATVVPATGTTDPDCSGAPLVCAGNNTATVTTTVDRVELTLAKTASVGAGSFVVGVPASYTLTVTNGGTTAMSVPATVTDTIPAGLTIGTLPAGCTASGQAVTCTVAAGLSNVAPNNTVSFVIGVTPTAAAAPSVTNTASVSGGGDGAGPAAPRCTASVTTALASTTLRLVKAWGANSRSGDVASLGSTTGLLNNTAAFSATASVDGNSDTVTVFAGEQALLPAETMAGGALAEYGVAVACTGGTLGGTDGKVANTLSILASDAGNPITCTYTNTFVQRAEISLDKTSTATSVTAAGDVIPYSLTATNTGNVALSNVTLSDPLIAALTCTPAVPVATLAIGASVTCTGSYTVTQADINRVGSSDGVDDGIIRNAATATGTPGVGAPVSDGDSVDVTLPPINVAGSLLKSAALVDTDGSGGASVGEVITYTFTGVNSGNVTLSNITITDPLLPSLACAPSGDLLPGQSRTFGTAPPAAIACTGNTYTVTQADVDTLGGGDGDIDNTATGSATQPDGTTVSATGTASVPVDAATPALTVDKTAGTPSGSTAGSTIAYSFLVTNTGNVTITGLVINDANLDAAAVCPVTTLAPGASTTCTGTHTITQAEVDAGAVNNSATATGTTPGGGTITSPADTTSTSIAANPSLTVDKTAGTPTYRSIGEVISYSYLVTNTGNVTITALSVADDRIASVSCPVTALAPAASTTCTGSYTVVAGDLTGTPGTITNIATANGAPALGTLTPATDTVTITEAPSAIDAVDDTGTVANGATGGTAVPNVLVNDTLNGNPATLATVTLTQVSTTNPNVTLDPATGAVNVAAGTPAGTYTLVYQICEQLNPTNCDPATA
ncbi:MAG: beta strand repeat-containing protein, partial [Silanimonas sp.]